MNVESIAKICHEVNRAWCEYQGDNSQVPWADAPQAIKDSAFNGVDFHLKNPDAGDSASHDNWLKFKKAEGYTYGSVKDLDAKTHPCFVSFDQLPREQQFKDRLFRTVVHAAE